ncbi:MAG TPA: hypothetical protein VFQ45_15385 [Longimicrobium sp.]|nr:hypothetical protein [Longimicrobium sp.]
MRNRLKLAALALLPLAAACDSPTGGSKKNYPALPSLSQWNGTWDFKGSYTARYNCDAASCKTYINVAGQTREAEGRATLKYGAFSVGAMQWVAQDTLDNGDILAFARAPISVAVEGSEGCYYYGGEVFGCAVNGGAHTSTGSLYVDYLLKPNASAAATETVGINLDDGDQIMDGTMPGAALATGLYATDGALDVDSLGWAIAKQ